MSWVINRKYVLGFGVALTAMVVVSVNSFINLINFKKANGWVEHTYQVKNNLDELLLQLAEAETDQRGYLLTGDTHYLERYQTAVKAITREIQELRKLTLDNSLQQHRLVNLEPLVFTNLAELQKIINQRRSKGSDVTLALIQNHLANALTDEIQQIVREMATTENDLLQKRSASAQSSARSTTLVIALGSILAATVVALAIFTLNQDINKRVVVEEKLKTLNEELEQRVTNRTQQLEEANRARDEFLSILSHELRTPLNAMLGWSRLLQTGNLNEAKKAQAIEIIERNAQSQAQLIEDILDVSRIIQGKLRLHVRPVQPVTVIEAAIDAMRPAADARSIRIQAVLDSSAGPISGDPDRLQQVMWNLLSNAIKFTPKKGRVQVRLERINSHIEITVSDTGQGISPDFLPYIFDRFRQENSTSTRAYGGLGLGLAIVRQLVELHGGTVQAFSSGEGQGSTFTVNLPLMIVHTDSSHSERVHPTVGGEVPLNTFLSLDGLHLLIVDDEADARFLLTTVLEECGATVTAVGSASEALDALTQFKPDLLVSDVGMPHEDGYQLIRKVRSLSPEQGGSIPAIALTAYARVEDRIRAVSAGFQMHVPKPIEPAELVAVIANLTRRTRNG